MPRPSAPHPASSPHRESLASCPIEDDLLSLAGGLLAASRRSALESHLGHCDDCRLILATIAPLIDAHATTAALSPARDSSPLLAAESPGPRPAAESRGLLPAAPGPRPGAGEAAGLLVPGEVVAGRFRVCGVLGAGGMGVVYEAEHLVLGSLVALKLIRTDRHSSPEAAARFLREARTLARLRGPHICRVLDAGQLDDGRVFVALERLDGADLATVLHERGPLPFAEAVSLLQQACEGLAEAHAAGIVHRDIKPANLFLTSLPAGEALKILDFGLAKTIHAPSESATSSLTGDHQILGSPAYMAPEQIRSPRSVDGRADVWALGALLHELLTGEPPFTAESHGALWAKILADPPADPRALRPDLPRPLAAVIARCLEKVPEKRFPTPDALAAALAALSPDLLAPSPAGSPAASPEPPAPAGLSVALQLAGLSVAPQLAGLSVAPRPAGLSVTPQPSLRRWLAPAAAVALLGLFAAAVYPKEAMISPARATVPAASGAIPSVAPPASATSSPLPSTPPSSGPAPVVALPAALSTALPTAPEPGQAASAAPRTPRTTAPGSPRPPAPAATASRD